MEKIQFFDSIKYFFEVKIWDNDFASLKTIKIAIKAKKQV
jgi:hypothetical protein